jgi:hypothetical protein
MDKRLKVFLALCVVVFVFLGLNGAYLTVQAQKTGVIKVQLNRSTVTYISKSNAPEEFIQALHQKYINSAGLIGLAVCLVLIFKQASDE